MAEKESRSLAERLSLLKTQKKLKNEVEEAEALKTKNDKTKLKQQQEKEEKSFFEKVLKNIDPILKIAIETCELKNPKIEIQETTGRLYLRWDKYLESHDDGRPDTIEYYHSISLQTEVFKKEFSFNDSDWREKFENWLIEQLSKELKF